MADYTHPRYLVQVDPLSREDIFYDAIVLLMEKKVGYYSVTATEALTKWGEYFHSLYKSGVTDYFVLAVRSINFIESFATSTVQLTRELEVEASRYTFQQGEALDDSMVTSVPMSVSSAEE